MAQLVGGTIGAGIGFILGGPAGAQWGWMIGSMIGGALAPTKANDPGPQKMPMFNQAVRGSPVFVTFGTNRVSPQLTWTKNWTPVRHKPSGKAGGSGGAKGGGEASVSYTYQQDVIYHFGIFDRPSAPVRGWNGATLINDYTMNAILSGGGTSLVKPTNIFPLRRVVLAVLKHQQNMIGGLDFVESFLAPGFATDSAYLEGWDYFEQQEGMPCAFPYNTYIGFKTLQLGASTALPQLSFEWSSGDTQFQSDAQFEGQITGAIYGGGGFALRDDDGNWYMDGNANPSSASHRVTLYRADSGNAGSPTHTVTDAEWEAALAAKLNLPYQGTWVFQEVNFLWGTPYFYLILGTNNTIGEYLITGLLCKVETDGSVTYRGCWSYNFGATSISLGSSDPNTVGLSNNDLRGRVYRWHQDFGTVSAQIHSYPGPQGQLITSNLTLDEYANDIEYSIPQVGKNFISIPELGTNFFQALTYRAGYTPVGWVSRGTVDDIEMVAYRSKAEVDWSNDNPGNPNASSYLTSLAATDAVIITMTLRYWPAGNFTTYEFHGSKPNFLRAADGSNLVPFADARLDSTGAPGTVQDDYFSPNTQTEAGGLMCRAYSDKPNKAKVLALVTGYTNTGDLYMQEATFGSGDYFQGSDLAGGTTVQPVETMRAFVDPESFEVWIFDNSQFSNNGMIAGKIGLMPPSMIDVTPAYIIFRILSSKVYGFGLSNIDLASYEDSHLYCQNEGILVSVTYTGQDSLLAVVDELLNMYGGYLIDDAGTIRFGVVRSTDTPDPVVVDNTRLLSPGKGKPPVSVTKPALQDGFNKVKMNYLDRDIDYAPNQVEIADEVDIDFNGVRNREYPARYVMAGSYAYKIAERALWSGLYGRNTYNFQLGVKDAHRQPGDLITLVDSFHHELRNGVQARIVRWRERKRLEFDVVAVQHIPYIASAVHSFTDTASWYDNNSYVTSIMPPLDFRMYELPQEFQGAQAKAFVGYNQASAVMGAQLHLSTDGSNFVLTQDVQPFIISGRLGDNLEAGHVVDWNVPFWLMPSSSFTISTPTFAQSYTMDDVSQGLRASGGGVFIVGSEAIAVENLTTVAQNKIVSRRVYRGWGGTPISAHNSGDFWHYHGAGIFTFDLTQDKIGTTLYYKVVPYNFAGVAADIAGIAAHSYTIKGLYWLPRVQPKSKVWVQSAVSWPRSTHIGEDLFLKTTKRRMRCHPHVARSGATRRLRCGRLRCGRLRPLRRRRSNPCLSRERLFQQWLHGAQFCCQYGLFHV
jgi:hypothetical protein